MLLSSGTTLGEIRRDFQRGFTQAEKAAASECFSLLPKTAQSHHPQATPEKKAPVPHVRNRRLQMEIVPFV
jgi:hypothetical protein